jgi:hypothetical protein
MTIEYVPRSGPAGGASWRTASGSAYVPAPLHTEANGGLGAVCVPVVPRRVQVSVFHWWILMVVLVNGYQLTRWGRPSSVTIFIGVPVAAVMVVLLVAYRALRLHRFTAREHLEVVLSSAGIHTGGLMVPWSEVEGVVRFGFAFGPGRGGPGNRCFVAVRVTDFVAVRGMSPVRAGLANLTRRHLLVLCEAREVHDPTAFADALDELVANPVARELLSGAEGERLLATGPSWRVSRR